MRNSITLLALVVLSVIAFTDTASAGLFGRVRARRTAEMQSAVAGQVGAAAAQLEANLDSQLATESAKIDEQLAAQGTKLEGQVAAGLAKLEEQAQAMLATESKKLEQQLASQVAKMHEDAKQAVVAESTKLRTEVEAKVAKLNASANAQIKDAIARFDSDMGTASTDMQNTMRDELAKLKTEVADMVKNQLAAANGPAPVEEPETPEEKAIPSTAVRLEDEKKG